MHAKLLQLCPTLCDPMDYSPPGSSVHGIHQARVLEWVATHSLLQGIFPTQGPDPSLLRLLHWQVHSVPLAPPGKPFPPRTGHYFSLFLGQNTGMGLINLLLELISQTTKFVVLPRTGVCLDQPYCGSLT